MFSSLSVSQNGKYVTLHETNYHYKAYIEKFLKLWFWRAWHASSLQFLVPQFACKTQRQQWLRQTIRYRAKSHTIELYVRLHSDLFNSDKMLINGVDMNAKIICAPEAICWHLQNYIKLGIRILDAKLLSLKSNWNPLFF